MKKIIHTGLLLTTIFIALTGKAQSVSINADSSKADASAILDLKSTKKGMLVPRMTMVQRDGIAAPATGLLIYQTDNTTGYYYYDGSAWTPLKSTGGGGGGTDVNWSATGADIHNANTGNVVIGNGTAVSKLTVQTVGYGLTHTDGNISLSTYLGGGTFGAWFGTRSNHSLFFFTNNSEPRMAIGANGNVGVGVNAPVNKFQIGNFTIAPVSGNDFVIAGNNNWLATKAFTNRIEMATSGNFTIFPTGNLGVRSRTPTNTLQIGDLGTTGFSGNLFAMGNGTAALGINQSNTAAQFASTTDFIFLPRYGANNGRVGINTSAPKAVLDVEGFIGTRPADSYAFFGVGFSNGIFAQTDITQADANISIYASNNIMGLQIDAFSDARIKDIKGISDSRKDLAILQAIKVTDYTFKDKIRNGTHSSKKVIAQQVEMIYPQIVSKHTDFIPNVYQLTDTVTKVGENYLLSFKNDHHLGDTAKMIQVLINGENHFESFDVVAIPSAKEIIINAKEIKSAHVFVYGEQVPDFRTVDYDGLTTLNISATQEISRLVNELKKTVAMQNKKIAALRQTVDALKQKPVNHLTRANIPVRTVRYQ